MKYLILDLGGVLIGDFDAAVLKLYPKTNFKEAKESLEKLAKLVDRGQKTFGDYVKQFNKLTGAKYSVGEYQRIKNRMVFYNHEFIKFCQRNRKYFKTSILSDNNKSNISYYNKFIRLNKWTYRQVYSYFYKTAKPDPKLFRIMLKKLKARPEECVYVDDRPVNVRAAKKLGISAILYKSNKQLISKLRKDFLLF